MPTPVSSLARASARRERLLRTASGVVLATAAGFVSLMIPSMRAYPGGTAWDPTTRGNDFWLNYLSDLQRTTAFNGDPNPVGSALARAAVLVLAVGLSTNWWLVATLLDERSRLGQAIRLTGAAGALGAIAAGLLPSDRFGDGHRLATLLGGVPGLAAVSLSVVALATLGPRLRLAAASGAAALLTATLDFGLYVTRIGAPGPDPSAIARLERLSLVLLLVWMCVVAWQAVRHEKR